IILMQPRHLGEWRQIAKTRCEGFLNTRANVAYDGLCVTAANIQRHTVAASLFIAINVLIAVSQAGKRCQNHASWQRQRIAEFSLQRDGLTVEFTLRSAGETGEISATNGGVV